MRAAAVADGCLALALCLGLLLGSCGPIPAAPLTVAPDIPPSAAPTITSAVPATPTATSVPATLAPATPGPTGWPSTLSPETAEDIAELVRWGRGSVLEIVYARDGRELALVTSLGVYIHDAESLALLRTIQAEAADYAVAFSPDWTTLAWASGRELLLLDATDGEVIRGLAGGPGRVASPAFSPDGSLLAVIRFPPGEEVYTGNLELWRVVDGTLLQSWDCGGNAVTFAPDGKSLATWHTMTGIRVWRVPSGQLLHSVEDWTQDVAFSPDGTLLAQVAMNMVRLWQMPDGSHAFDLESNDPDLRGIAFSPDGARLGAVSGTGHMQVWELADGQALSSSWPGPGTSYGALAFSPDGQTLASATMDVTFWRLPEGQQASTLEGFFPPVRGVAMAPGGSVIVAVTEGVSASGSNVWLLDPVDGSHRSLAEGGEALSLAISPDGSLLAVGMWDFSVRLLQLPDGEILHTMTGHPVQVQSVAFSPDGSLLASSSMGEVRLWRTSDGSLLRTLEVPRGGWMEGAAFSPDGDLLAALSADARLLLWQVPSGDLLKTLQARDDGYSGHLAFSPDGASVALAKHDLVLVWRIGDGTLVETHEVPAGTSHVAFSPDGSLLANDGGSTIQLWRRVEGDLLHTLTGHAGVMTGLAFSGDGRFLVSSSWDGTVRLWGVAEP